jgi:hypothetical protein
MSISFPYQFFKDNKEKLRSNALFVDIFVFTLGLVYGSSVVYFFDTSLFWDDNILLDKRLVFQNANPIHFWVRDSQIARSWPMTYFINWMASIVPEFQFTFLRILLVVTHAANAFLVFKILAPKGRFAAKLASSFFLVHSFHFLTLSWTFQVFTCAAVFFFLLVVNHIINKKEIQLWKVSLFYYLSLVTKSLAMAMVVLPWLNSKISITKKIILSTTFLLFSLYLFNALNGGIATFATEYFESKKLIPTAPKEGEVKIIVEGNAQSPPLEKILDANEKGLLKTIIFLNNFRYYLKNVIVTTELTMFQKNDTELGLSTIASGFLLLLFLGGILYFITFKPKSESLIPWGLFIFLFGFLPISGIFYVPHFKHSFTSPHWSYLPLVGASFLFFEVVRAVESKKLLKGILFIYLSLLCVLQLHHRYKFSDRLSFLEKNVEILPNSTTLEFLINLEKAKKEKPN